jgi:hypothetical protein
LRQDTKERKECDTQYFVAQQRCSKAGQERTGMMPDKQALDVFYGTVPLILVLLWIAFRKEMLLRRGR